VTFVRRRIYVSQGGANSRVIALQGVGVASTSYACVSSVNKSASKVQTVVVNLAGLYVNHPRSTTLDLPPGYSQSAGSCSPTDLLRKLGVRGEWLQ
jgi:hypothetical protein